MQRLLLIYHAKKYVELNVGDAGSEGKRVREAEETREHKRDGFVASNGAVV